MRGDHFCRLRIVTGLALLVLVSGCATTGGDPRDPLEGLNRGIYTFNEAMDDALFDPLGKVYKAITPGFIDEGVTNFFSNLNDISVVVNDILQLKFNQAVVDTVRLFLNTTVGLLGINDIASEAGIPKNKEDFGQTLAYWGVGAGPYLVAPFFGPTTLRDAAGFAVDGGLLNPVFYLESTKAKAGLLSLNYVDFKADLLSAKEILGEAALDEYEFLKNAYFEKRRTLIEQ
ncbi:MAG TPA: VacJ family lipoprotein [Gammaproteobacteria bacterium]|nr:VacJ family lipoprotein [Gammaproteobacteria bacterium]